MLPLLENSEEDLELCEKLFRQITLDTFSKKEFYLLGASSAKK